MFEPWLKRWALVPDALAAQGQLQVAKLAASMLAI
ncbi:hypothetical protein PS928_00024 [Pseudomonas fluorescens]|uniref:Uncharacterized protein n=1 Tax=Pseudomonas fluorescens TaxID=294 RepID=A0A5E7RI10_PSEFL|nr:hypothetical protein PS928_00024 [Pseudomonas fluorescens]